MILTFGERHCDIAVYFCQLCDHLREFGIEFGLLWKRCLQSTLQLAKKFEITFALIFSNIVLLESGRLFDLLGNRQGSMEKILKFTKPLLFVHRPV